MRLLASLPALALLALVAAPAPAAAEDDPFAGTPLEGSPYPVCRVVTAEDGTTGAVCGLANVMCTQALWGYHSPFLTVGGNSGCSGGVLVNPNRDPREPPSNGGILGGLSLGDALSLEI